MTEGKPIRFDFPPGATAKEIADALKKLREENPPTKPAKEYPAGGME